MHARQMVDRITVGGLSQWAPRIGLAVATALFLLPAIAHGVDVWLTDEEFSYGFLIPPLAACIIWWRRNELASNVRRGANAGLVIAVLAIGMTLLGRRLGIHVLGGIAISPLLWGVAVYLWGWRVGRILAFPLTFLIFGFGLYRGLLNSLGFALQNITAAGAAWGGHLLGLHVVRDGLLLKSEAFGLVVAQACSGMSSLLSLLALAALWMYATRGTVHGRSAVCLSVLPLVVLANTTRVTLVLLVASWLGQDAALGFFHGASDLVLFGLALVGLFVISRVAGCKFTTFAT
jgi:exosortase